MQKGARFLRFTALMGLATCLSAASAQADTWVTPGNLRPVYKVEAVSFHCNDETGLDNPWFAPWISDEVRVGIGTHAATTVSKVFGNVDSGETWSFAPDQSCIYPIKEQSPTGNGVFTQSSTWTCSDLGTTGPISFRVVMAEEDSGVFHDCLENWGRPGGCAFFSDERVPDPNDDVIGQHKVEFTPEELAFAMPNVGDFIQPVITLEGGGGPSAGADFGQYTFTYRITRVPLQLQ